MLATLHGTDLFVFSSHEYFSEVKRTPKLMHALAKGKRVYFFHPPIIGMTKKPTVYYNKMPQEVAVIQPYIPENQDIDKAMTKLMREMIRDEHISHLSVWTDSAEFLPLIKNLSADQIIFDKPSLTSLLPGELELMGRASIVLGPKMSDDYLFEQIDDLLADQSEHCFLFDSYQVLSLHQQSLDSLHFMGHPSRASLISKYQNH